jgi:hypothetical protein
LDESYIKYKYNRIHSVLQFISKEADHSKKVKMAIFVLYLMFILSVVEGQFTAFHRAQADSVHEPVLHGGYQGLDNNLYQNVPSTSQGFQRNSGLLQRQQASPPQPPLFSGNKSLFSSSGNIVEQTKATAESARTLFKSLENVTLVPQIFDHVFRTSNCLGNVQGAIELMDESEKLVVENGPEIIYLEAIVDNLENEKNITKLIQSSAKMLRILESLVPKLSDKSSKLCISNPNDSIEDFRDLAHVLVDILKH